MSATLVATPSLKLEAHALDYYSKNMRERYMIGETKIDTKPHLSEQPDIAYEPDLEKYQARAAARLAAGNLDISLPRGWPTSISGPLNWEGGQLEDERAYVYHLTHSENEEITAALEHFKGLGLDGKEVTRDNFPLPTLEDKLQLLAYDLHHGKGFFVLRGLDQDRYSKADSILVFLGISAYVAERKGKQGQRGDIIIHVADTTTVSSEGPVRPTVENRKGQHFHNDVMCDVLALYALGCPTKGGSSLLSSTWRVYNELAATRPDLIQVLAAPDWPFDTFGRDPPYIKRPLLFYHDGKILFSCSRFLFTGRADEPRTPGIPNLTEAQADALDAVHFTAKKFQFKMALEPGDMRFINNLALLHARESFEDDTSKRRHLVRLWLHNEQLAWKLPPPLQMAWDRAFEEDPNKPERWELSGSAEANRPLRRERSCE